MRLILIAILVSHPIAAADWPGWRGPTVMGQSPDKDLPVTWGGKDNASIRWQAPLYPGTDKVRFDQNQSSPIVVLAGRCQPGEPGAGASRHLL
jgi:hypothetical protein